MNTTHHALLIGIVNYPKIADSKKEGFVADLKGCHHDVEKMRRVLVEARGFEAQHVRTLIDSEEALVAATAQEAGGREGAEETFSKSLLLPTRVGILRAMEELLMEVQEGDVVLFYFSGHGSRVRNPRWPGRVFETLVPHDSGRGKHENRDIFDLEIDSWIRRLDQKRVASTTLIFDSCHSGSVTRGGAVGEEGSHVREVPPDHRAFETMFQQRPAPDFLARPSNLRGAVEGFEVRQNSGWLSSDRSAVVVAACGAEQKAKEMPFMVRRADGERFSFERGDVDPESRHHGVLTMFLAEELRNPEHQRWSQLVRAVQKKVEGETASQQSHLEGDGPLLSVGGMDFAYRAPAASLELQRHALVIGISDYSRHRGVTPLKTPVTDATAVAEVLEKGHGYNSVECLFQEDATLEAIVQKLRSLKRHLGPSSALVLYFAGHGMAEGTSDFEFEGYLWPVDADHQNRLSWLRMDAVMRELAGFRCRHLLVILDCCFAGAFVASFRGAPRSRKMFRSQFERAVRGQAWQLLASSAHNQLARDEDATGTGHSPFANALLTGLGSEWAEGRADLVDDGIVTATELFLHIEQSLLTVPGQKPSLRALSPLNEGEFVFLSQDKLERLEDDPQLEEHENPWRGIEAYSGAEGEPLLQGREEAVQELLIRLDPSRAHGVEGLPGTESGSDLPVPPRLLLLEGPSGSGKTSLVRAGLLPRLQTYFQGASHPEKRSEHDNQFWSVAEILHLDSKPLVELERAAAELKAAPGEPWQLLYIDHFDALQEHSDEVQASFLERLREFAEKDFPKVQILICLQSGTASELTERVSIAGRVEVYELQRPRLDELRGVILGPAQQRLVFFESEKMIDEILEELEDSPTPLGLLSLTMGEIYRHAWRRQAETGMIDRELKKADLRAVGGIGGALAARAESVHQRASRSSKKTLRRLFLRMVSLESTEPTSRRVPREELESWHRWPRNEQRRAQIAVRELLTERLLVLDRGHLQLPSSHLLRAWTRLQGWLSAPGEQDFQRGLRSLGRAAKDWQQQSEDFRLLLNDRHPRVTEVSKRQQDLNRLEHRFVDACRRQRKISHRLWAALAVLAMVCGLAFFLYQDSEKARREFMVQALALQAMDEAKIDWTRGVLLALQAVETAQKSGGEHFSLAEEALQDVLSQGLDSTSSVGRSVQDLIAQACDAAGRNLTKEEWKKFVPNESYRPLCENHQRTGLRGMIYMD